MTTNTDALFVDSALLNRAEQICQQRLKADPDNRTVLRSLAEIHRKLGKREEAAAVYERIVQLDPRDQEAEYLQAVLRGEDWTVTPAGLRATPFVVLRDFLPREFHDGLIPFVISMRDRFVPAKAYNDQQGTLQYTPDFRETLDYQGEWAGKRRFYDCLVEVLPRAAARLGIAPFSIRDVEITLRASQDGNFLKVHMDAPPGSTRAGRVVSFVFYFHRLPRAYTGGDLLLFDSDIESNTYTTSRFTRVVPEDGSLVIFPSQFYHCVVPTRCPSKDFADSRFSIGGFVRKRGEALSAARVVREGRS